MWPPAVMCTETRHAQLNLPLFFFAKDISLVLSYIYPKLLLYGISKKERNGLTPQPRLYFFHS
jgi:hypothetical protein